MPPLSIRKAPSKIDIERKTTPIHEGCFYIQKKKGRKNMKKLTCIIMAVLLLCLCTVAYAAEPLTLDITALDYQTGRAVSKTYVPNELFSLRVDIGIPRFYDLTDMELMVELDGVELDEYDIVLADGTYYLTGIVTDQPAALRVTVKDKAYANAETAEELWKAQQQDRTVSKTYYFNVAQQSTSNSITIPKTGDYTVLAYAVPLALIGLGLAVTRKKK